jgi:hypothetical protein
MSRTLGRLVPFLLIVVLLAVATERGRALTGQLIDGVKVFLTRLEMDSFREALEHEYQRTGSPPGAVREEDLFAFAQEHVDQRGREPGHDTWGNPYVITKDFEGVWLLVSMGPNGEPDDTCDTAEPDPETGLVGDDVCVELRLDAGAAAF